MITLLYGYHLLHGTARHMHSVKNYFSYGTELTHNAGCLNEVSIVHVSLAIQFQAFSYLSYIFPIKTISEESSYLLRNTESIKFDI